MKKSVLFILSFATMGAIALSGFERSSSPVYADHSHTYINGACECGAHLFEAEDGEISGICTDPSDGFIITASSNNPAHPTSGGKVVGNWAQGGNRITRKFHLSEELENINVRLWVSTGQVSQASTAGLSLTVNGARMHWVDTVVNVPDVSQWYYFNGVNLTGNFAQGNNQIVLSNVAGTPWNIDCIEIEFPSTTVVSAFVEGEPLGTVPGSEQQEIPDVDPLTRTSHLLMEAENCHKIEGTIADGGASFFETNPLCSNGGLITNWGQHGDNIAYWNFSTNKAVEVAYITYYISCLHEGIEIADAFIPRINGGSGGAPEFNRCPGVYGIDITACGLIPHCEDLYDFYALTTPAVSLLSGANVLEAESFAGHLVNIDYIIISTNEEVEFTFVPKDNGVGGQGGPKTLEAEDADVTGTVSDEGDAFVIERTSNNPDHPTSGDYCVGFFGHAGNKITWVFTSSNDVSSFPISLWVAPCGSGGSISDIISFTVNGEEQTFDQSVFPAYQNDDKWYMWTELTVSNAKIKRGVNTIVLTNTSGQPFNVDCIELKVPDECIINTGGIDKSAPEISIIKIKTRDIKTFEPVEFDFDYRDDISPNEAITLIVNVYYNFGKADQDAIRVRSNKFTPEKLGEYTIIVRATDKAGNSAEKRRIVLVTVLGKAEDEEGRDPLVPDNPGTKTNYVNKKVVGGWLVFSLGLAAAGGLIAFMVVFTIMKRR